ncbi:MAG: alpha/beta fold hydrolase [Rubrivivax sp.]|nr:alpha/beta fold hydrolase [Rubrivivax sp.]
MTPSHSLQDLAGRLQHRHLPFENGLVAWHCMGEGPPLVLLHGGHGSWAHWARNLPALARHFTVCAVDLPGYGESSLPVEPTLASLLDATHSTLDALLGAGTPILLAGFSFGGLVATHLAARRGAVRALALLGPAGHGAPRRPRGEQRPWREALANGDDAALQDAMRHNLELHMLAGPANEEALAIHLQACQRTRFHSKRLSRAASLGDSLQALRCPVLLAWGEHDVTASPHALAPLLAARCTQAQTRVVPGAGHWVQYEAADAVNRLLVGWLTAPGVAAGV